MNTVNIKKYAPLARNAFITAVTKRANELGIYDSHIEEAIEEGEVLKIEGRSVDLKLKGARNKLLQRVESAGFTVLMEFIAYTWFNRLCAIRFMELHNYLEHGLRVLAPSPSQGEGWGEGGLPEILDHAQDVAEDLGLNRDQIIELKLAGNQDELLYRTLLLGQCHALHKAMPFLFEAIDDETELLLPDNLTRTDSILRGLVNEIPEEDWEQVEIIGWLYQFYISEKKDEVIGKVVKSEDIPAATQLFTPNWIVKYLVQNSVGRQWLQTYPDSSIKSAMEYYIEPAEQTDEVNAQIKAITPDSIDPESIKVLDPACGSGHILVEAYQVLKAIYEERGYRSRDIPQLILENNLFGLDIDDRAAQLAGFALMMLARADDRRIFTRDVQLNVSAIQSTVGLSLQHEDCLLIKDEQQRHEFVQNIQDLLVLYEQAKTFGSLIEVPEPIANYLPTAEKLVTQLAESGDLFAQHTASTLRPIIKQTEILARKYDAVVANPPYIGSKGMNVDLKKFAKDHYPNTKSDLFAVFIERCLEFGVDNAELGLVTPYVWMFIGSYEKLREELVENHTLNSLIQLEYNAFAPACIPVCTFTISKQYISGFQGGYIRLSDFKGHENQAPRTLEAIHDPKCGWFHNAKPDDFKKIPGSPISYWVSKKVRKLFSEAPSLKEIAKPKHGMSTGNNDRFLRYWYEGNIIDMALSVKDQFECISSEKKWFPYNKGGEYRKWYGNRDFIINYKNFGEDIKRGVKDGSNSGARILNESYFFKPCVTWGDVTSGPTSFRFCPDGAVFDGRGSSAFPDKDVELVLSFLNSLLVKKLIPILNPTLVTSISDIEKLPLKIDKNTKEIVDRLVSISIADSNSYETSWDFSVFPMMKALTEEVQSIGDSYMSWLTKNSENITETQGLEEDNNRLLIDVYGLQDELTPEVPLEQITLTINPKYRYGGKLSDEALEKRFQSDSLAELISYAIGCMMGRYSLDQEGLVYAHACNEGFTELEQQGAYKTFPADDDGIIPLTDQEWFADDATHRFREFVRVVWGEDNLQQNLDFVAESLCLYAIKAKSGESSLETIRRYLSTKFYKDHLKTYKKRPIYWLFSSGKQKAFECLVYLHRYNESTLSRMRTEYVTPLLGKYEASAMVLEKQMQDASTTAESNRFKKSLTALEKKQTELSEFDDKLKQYTDMRISLDLDDGVKVNYGKFGDLLADVKTVHGKAPTV